MPSGAFVFYVLSYGGTCACGVKNMTCGAWGDFWLVRPSIYVCELLMCIYGRVPICSCPAAFARLVDYCLAPTATSGVRFEAVRARSPAKTSCTPACALHNYVHHTAAKHHCKALLACLRRRASCDLLVMLCNLALDSRKAWL